MADVLRIKRRYTGGAAGAPTTLANGELAYNEVDDKLYYGKGNNAGQATSIIPIAGPGMGYSTGGGGSSITMADVPPGSPVAGQGWWDSTSGQLFLYYSDPNSSQWVPAFNIPAGAATTPFLQLTGGQLSGPLAINRAIPAGGNAGNLFVANTVTTGNLGFNAYVNAASTLWLHLTGTGTAGVFYYDTTTNYFSWLFGPNAAAGATTAVVTRMTLDNAGALSISGTNAAFSFADRVSGPYWQFYASGSLARLWNSTGGEMLSIDSTNNVVNIVGPYFKITGRAALYGASDFLQIFTPAGGAAILLGGSVDPKNYYRNTSHNFQSIAGGAEFVQISATGILVQAGITAIGNIFTNGGIFADNAGGGGAGQFGMSSASGFHFMQMWPQWYFDFDTSTGTCRWITPISGSTLWVMRADTWTYNNIGPVGGVGAFQVLSDERSKTAITKATVGLAEILEIVPIEFERIYDGPKAKRVNGLTNEIGFSAQQLAPVIPQAVTIAGFELPDGSGTMADVNPTLTVGLDSIVAALVNAVKELYAEIEALKAAK